MKIKFKKNTNSILYVGIVLTASFLVAHFAHAQASSVVASILNWILSPILNFLGGVLTLLIDVLKKIALYNDFIAATPVKEGWSIVRDLCNMFFILILLIIAFATILRVESYNAKKALPKLLIMAVLINFSKTICGIFIDFAQVIMLTFVNGFAAVMGGNIVSMLGLDKITSITATSKALDVTDTSIFGAYMLALAYLIIAVIVLIVMIAVLAYRVVMIWVYVVLSPLAYLLAAIPAGQKYSSQWWSEFSKQLIVGPVLAFFIWLSFVSASTFTNNNTPYDVSMGITPAGTTDHMIKFVISIAMLVGGLIVTQQLGGAAGSFAGKGMMAIQGKYGPTPMRWGRERWDAFQGRREQARKGKAADFGGRMYARYNKAVQAPKAVLKTAAQMGVDRLTGSSNTVRDIRSKWDERKKRKTQQKLYEQNLSEAHEAIYKKGQNEYKKGGFIYYDKDGKIAARQEVKKPVEGVDIYGQPVKTTARVTVQEDADIKPFSKNRANFRSIYNREISPAAEIKNQAVKAEVDKIKANFNNLSPAELRRILTDAFASQKQKSAATMMLAQKEGFDNINQMQNSKQNIINYQSLLKDFNDTVNKRFGLWNSAKIGADGNWEVDPQTFKANVADGTIRIDNLDTSQIDNKGRSLELIRDTVGNSKYSDTMKSMIKTTVDKDRIKEASRANINLLANDTSKEAMQHRRFHAILTGNLNEAYNGNSDHIKEFISKSEPNILSNIDDEDFDKIKKEFGESIRMAQLDGLLRSGKVSNELMTKMVRAAIEHGGKELHDAISKNNNLNSLA